MKIQIDYVTLRFV